MNCMRSLLLGAAIVALTASTGFAQSSSSGTDGPYLRLEGGWSHPVGMDSSIAGVPLNTNLQDGYIVGGAGGYKFGPWRAELNLDYSDDNFKSGSIGGFSSNLSGDASNLAVMVNGYYDIATGTPWVPYIGFGIGITQIDLNNVKATPSNVPISNSSDTQFAYQPMVGIQYLIDSQWSAGVEYRYFASSDGHFKTATGELFTASNSSHNVLASLTYHFAPPAPPPAAAPPVPAPRAAPAAAAPPAQQLFLVFFEFDRASLTPEGRKVVDAAAAAFKSGKSNVAVAGYTDLSGTAAYNIRLSKRRADTVKAALVRDGVPAGAINESWHGKENPRVPTADGVRDPQNCRVEIRM